MSLKPSTIKVQLPDTGLPSIVIKGSSPLTVLISDISFIMAALKISLIFINGEFI